MSFLDLTNTPISTNELLPDGTYCAKIAKSELKETKSRTGSYLNVQFKITEGQYANRSVFNTYNVKNDNPTAVKIGLEQLATMASFAGAPLTLSSPSDIEGYDVIIKVGTKSDSYGEKNIIKGYDRKLGTNNTSVSSQEIPF